MLEWVTRSIAAGLISNDIGIMRTPQAAAASLASILTMPSTRGPTAAFAAGIGRGRRRACASSSTFMWSELLGDSTKRPMAAASMSSSAAAGAAAATAGASSGLQWAEAGMGREQQHSPEHGMVSSLSPSSVAAYKQCPQLFYYRYILGLKSPPTRETLKGTVVHEVISRFLALEKDSRKPGQVHELFREVMTRLVAEGKEDPARGYGELFDSQERERKWVLECLDLLANFVRMESVNAGVDAEHVELKMIHTFGENDADGAVSSSQDAAVAAMKITGIVDRIDRCPDGTVRVVDYKTGKVPDLKYPEETNRRIMDDKFFQLQIYALLVERVLEQKPGELCLVYLKGPASVTRKVKPSALASVESELQSVWDDIVLAVQRDDFPTRTGRLCDWCSFKNRCPAFAKA